MPKYEPLDSDFISEAEVDLMFADEEAAVIRVESEDNDIPFKGAFKRLDEGIEAFDMTLTGMVSQETARDIMKILLSRNCNRPDLEKR